MSSHLSPAVNGFGFGREIDAEFDYILAAGEEWFVVALFLDLFQRNFGGFISLQFNDIDILVCVKDNVNPAVGCLLFCLDIEPHHFQHYRHHVLEVQLQIALYHVTVSCEKCSEAVHESLGVALLNVAYKLIDR